MRTWIVLLGCFLAATAQAEDTGANAHGAQRIDLDSVAALVATLGSCAALHAAAATMLDREHLPDYAETARRRAMADLLAAMYLLREDRVAKGGIPQELVAYTAYVEELTAAAAERVAAIVASGDPAPFKREEDFCGSLIPLEDEILAKIAAETVPAPAADEDASRDQALQLAAP